MTDHYLSKVPIQKEMLQLIGSTAMLIASKFEVNLKPPAICDGESCLVVMWLRNAESQYAEFVSGASSL